MKSCFLFNFNLNLCHNRHVQTTRWWLAGSRVWRHREQLWTAHKQLSWQVRKPSNSHRKYLSAKLPLIYLGNFPNDKYSMVVRPWQLWKVWSHVTWSVANEIEEKVSCDQMYDVSIKSGRATMTSKITSKIEKTTYMEMCSLKREIKNIMTVTSESRPR